MRTTRNSFGSLAVLTAAFFFGTNFTLQAQTNFKVRPFPQHLITQNPVFTRNPAAGELVSNLLAEPQPELSVPAFSMQPGSAPGTYWTLKGAAAPLPLDPFPDLPVYAIGTNDFLIDDRSVDYTALEAQQQAKAGAEGLTNPPLTTCLIDTNGLWLEVPPDSLADSSQFKVILHNTIQGQSYDFLTKSDLLYPAWATELTTTGAVGNATEVELSMNARPMLFVRARISPLYSFYLVTQPLSQYVEDGDMVTFSVETGGNTNLTFQWTTNGIPIAGATNSSDTINIVQDSDAGAYAVIISDGTNSLVTPAAQLTTDSGNPLGPYQTGDFNLIPILGARQNYTFRDGVTYYINSSVSLYGNTAIEGGAILKFDSDYSTNSSLVVMGGLICKGESYNPSILTSIDDDAIGEWVSYSSGYPQTAATGTPYLELAYAQSNSISNLRVCFADWGVTTPAVSRRLDVWDCQFVQCNYGVVNLVASYGAVDSLHNVLFAACGAAVGASINSVAIEGEQVTADVDDFCLADSTPSRIALTNSIVRGNSPTASSLSTVHVAVNPDDTNFLSEGNGYYYLAANSPLHNAGTAGISSRLQSELQHKTTCSPVPIAAFTQISGSLTLSPQASRYTNGAPDLGYYYDALDYSIANLTVSGGNLTVLPGTAIAVRNDYIPGWYLTMIGYCNYTVEGFVLQQGSSFVSHGTPANPNIFTAEKMVQEFPETDFSWWQLYEYGWWFGAIAFVTDFELGDNTAPGLDFRFSKFYLSANDYHIWAGLDEYDYLEWSPDSSMYLSLRDCSVHGGRINLGNPDDPSQVYASGAVTWLNNSFESVSINVDPTYYWYDQIVNSDMQLLAYNNLFKGGGWLRLMPFPTSAGNWTFEDNLFDKIDFLQDTGQPLDFDYNAYWPKLAAELMWVEDTSRLSPATGGNLVGAHEQVLTTAPPYQSGPFGKFYLPNTTPLYGAGSTNATGLGFYHYTTHTNQFKEGSEASGHMANIGLHYIAANSYGQPMDSDGDGIPDYVENWHGDGNYQAHTDTETDWQNPMTDGVTPDPYNTVYDNVDLSGDGLTGQAKRFFGTNPLIQDNPLSLLAVPQQSTLSGTLLIPLNINTNVDTNTTFILQVNGITQNTLVYQTNSNWFAEWVTTEVANGAYQLSMEFDLDEDTPVGGATKFVNIQNAVCFPNSLPICGSALYVQPQTINTNGTYTMDIYDDQTNLFASLNGNVDGNGFCDDPNAGQPGITVSLQDTNGNQWPSEFYTVQVTTYPAVALAQSKNRMHPNQAGGGGGSSGTHPAYYEHPWSGNRMWVIAFQAIYGPVIQYGDPGYLFGQMMGSVVGAVITSPYGPNNSVNGEIQCSGGESGLMLNDPNNPSPYDPVNWNQLAGLLTDCRARNFYYYGHGSGSQIGKGGGTRLTHTQLQNLLTNTPSGGDPLYTPNLHPYRFVFLDGCNTANGSLSKDFGIPNYTVPQDDWDNKYHLPPRAFLGWPSFTGNTFGTLVGTILPTDHFVFIENFFGNWSSGQFPLQNAINNANLVYNYWTQQYEPGSFAKGISIYGDPVLPFYQ